MLGVMPLCARSLVYSLAKPSTSSGSFGDRIVAPVMSTPIADALARITALVPEQGQVGDSEPQQAVGRPQDPLVVALRQHHVPAIGPGPLDQPVLEHQRRDHVGLRDVDRVPATPASSTDSANTRSAVSCLTGWTPRSADPGPRRAWTPSRTCRSAVTRIGRSCWIPSISCRTGLRRGVAAGQHDRRRGSGRSPTGAPGSAPGSRSDRSPGAITVLFSRNRVSTFGSDIAAISNPIDSRCSHSGLPRTSSAPQACCRSATVGATSSGISGMAPTAQPGRAQQRA